MQTPDITKAQILAGLAWLVAQTVSLGWIDNDTGMIVTQITATIVSLAWIVGDSIIRHGRSRAFQNPPKPPAATTTEEGSIST